MRPTTRTALIALAIGTALLGQAHAQAQVRVFEDTPSIEELRAILIPESHGGVSRRIEFPRHDVLDAAKPIQPAAVSGTTSQPASQPQATPTADAPGPTNAPAASAPEQVAPAAAQEPAKPAPATATAVGFHINFAFNSAVIPPANLAQLDQVVALMHQEGALSLAVEGHTDAAGTVDYNIELSRRRATAVVRYLADHGVDASRLMAVGKGKSEPLVADPMDGRNRRVQFLRLESETTS
jgi:outer membrane protein OmpA-like peptidoglycan-associated protein